jgi:hypothetical protein
MMIDRRREKPDDTFMLPKMSLEALFEEPHGMESLSRSVVLAVHRAQSI